MPKLLREIILWFMAISMAIPSVYYGPSLVGWQPFVEESKAAVSALSTNGVFFYGDTGAAGVMRARTFDDPTTYNAEFNGISGSASNILHVAAKTAVTREEIMIGSLRVNGTLQIESCTTACDANGDFSNRWSHASVTGTQDCDSAPTLGTCFQAFDIGYEARNGKAMVVYAGDGADGGTVPDADTVYYAEWDGSAWAPNTTPGTPGTSNDIDLGGATATGTPEWIRFVPTGENLADDRSDRGMLIVSDSNDDLWGCYWDGSTWSCETTAFETSLGNCDRARCFDGNWQGNNIFVLSYNDGGDATDDIEYRTYTVGTGWSGETQAYTTAAPPSWIISASDPTSSRIYVTSITTGNDTRGAVWRADDVTPGWTVCASGSCPDTITEAFGGAQSSTVFERFNGEALHVYHDSGNGTAQTNKGMTYTPTSTWGTSAVTGITPTDDEQNTKAVASPNSDDIMIMATDVDCDWDAVLWNGSGYESATNGNNLETVLASSNNSCANSVPIAGMMMLGYDFAWKIYTPWQRNWRWTNGATDTASTPTTFLANENTAPTGITSGQKLRLRVNYAERGRSVSNTDARKKLQWTSGCNPNSVLEPSCSWTDVADSTASGVPWRYLTDAELACTATDCDDNTTITGTVLTGTGTGSAGLGWGTWVGATTGTATNMDHTAQSGADTVQEAEYTIYSDDVEPNTTYYFRLYNIDQETMLYTEEDADDCGPSSNADCTYPSLTTANPTFEQAAYRWFDANSTESHITENAVDTSTSTTATQYMTQRKVFWDSYNNVWWAVHYNGATGSELVNSSNGTSWTSRQTLGGMDTNDFSFWYVEGTNVAYLVFRNSTAGISGVKCILTATSADCSSSAGIDSDTGNDQVSIARDFNGYLWVVYHDIDTDNFIYANRSSNPDNISSWGAQKTVATSTSPSPQGFPVVVPMTTSGDMYFIWDEHSASINGRLWDDSAGDFGSPATIESINPESISAVATATDQVHVVYMNNTNGNIRYALFSSGSWGTPVTLDSNAGNNYGTITVDNMNSDDLYAFWIRSNTIFMKKGVTPYASGNWDASPTTLVSTGTSNIHLTSAYRDGNAFAPLIWTDNDGASPFPVNFYGRHLRATDVGSALATTNNPATLTSDGQSFRLRLLLHIGNVKATKSFQNMKLQFATKVGTCDTSFTDETYADVTGSSAIKFQDNTGTGMSDGVSLTNNTNDPTHGGGPDPVTSQTYEELNNFTNSVYQIQSGRDGKWDFSLADNDGTSPVTYCFRVRTSADADINTYTVIPELSTIAPPAGPTVDQVMRHGNWFSSGVEQGFFWAN